MSALSINQKLLLRRGSRIQSAFHAWRVAGSPQTAGWLDRFAVEHENMYEELMRVKHAGETAVLHPIAWSLHYRRSTSEPSSDDWIFLVSAQDPDIVEMLENEAVPVPDGTEDFEEVDEAPQETRWWKFMNIAQNPDEISDRLYPRSSPSLHGEIQRGSPTIDFHPSSVTPSIESPAPTSNHLQTVSSATVDAEHNDKNQGSAVSGIKKVTLILPPRLLQNERPELASDVVKKRKRVRSPSEGASDCAVAILASRPELSRFKHRKISDTARRSQNPVNPGRGGRVEGQRPDGQRRRTMSIGQQWSKKRPFTKAELDFMTGAEKVKLAPCQRCEAISRDCIPQGIGKRCANCVRTRRACTYVAKGRFLADPSTYWDILLRNAERPIPVLPAVPYLYPLHKVDQTGIDHGELIKKLRRPITCEDAERPLEEAELLGLASIGDNMGSEVEEVSEATLASPVQVSRVIVPYNEPVPEDITRAIAAMKDLYQKETAVLQGGPGSGLAGAIQSLVTEFATPSALGFLS